MQTRRRISTAYRSRPTRSGRPLPDHMKGVNDRRTTTTYPTIEVENEETK